MEAFLKMISHGLIVCPGSYLRDYWNWIDFIVTIVSVFELTIDL